MSSPIRVGIIGAAGYTGGELLRLLCWHPSVTIAFAQSDSQAGRWVSDIHRDLLGDIALPFCGGVGYTGVDLIFLCKGHGASRAFLSKNPLPAAVRLIDLSMDFRWQHGAATPEQDFVYGLPELNHSQIKTASKVANPGCFATAIQLALLPLANAGQLKTTHITGITGSTGAGQQLQDSLHFSWRANNLSPYKTLNHQHIGEVKASLQQLQPEVPTLHFIPWRGDFTRGIFVSAICPYEGSLASATYLYHDFYQQAAFTNISRVAIDLKQVLNTNKCLLNLEVEAGQLVVHCALDNLLKGASGQAVQNMNLMFGLEERTGLQLKPAAF